MSEPKRLYNQYANNFLRGIWAVLFLILPLFFLTATTETFVFPKQIIISLVVFFSLVVFGIKTIAEKKVKFSQTFLDLPVFLFIFSLFLSFIFSVDRINSLIALIPLLLVGMGYFIVTNIIREEETAFLFASAMLASATIAALLAIFSFLKVYLFPFAFTHVQFFTPFGSLLDQAIYFAALLPISLYFSLPLFKGKNNGRVMGFSVISLILIAGLGVTVYQLLTTQKPVILPFQTGFQIAFAAISQDSPRIAQGFFLGSGVGTFFEAFSRFKQPAFNLNQNLWFLNFTQSTSFVLELLTTTGLLGILSFLFILAKSLSKPKKTMDNPIFFSVAILSICAFLFPFSYTILAVFFFLLAIFSSTEALKTHKSFDLELSLIALKKNLFNIHSEESVHKPSLILPVTFLIIVIIFACLTGYYSVRYVASDILFNQSLVAASNNDGALTYRKEVDAINMFPYRDGFYRIFSQTNLSIAGSLLTLNKDSQNSQTQQTAFNLVQQAINVGRTATTLSPMNTLNWQNLGGIYRNLINVGQNADTFAIAATQQAIILDSANPQEFVTLGGIYYQLGQYDNAIRQFQVAVNLKPDFANAYYNLGHAYEAKGDLENALNNYQTVRTLVASDKANLDKINGEIDALSKKISSNNTQIPSEQTKPAKQTGLSNQEPLNINQSSTLPQQANPIKLPPPAGTSTPTPTPR